MCRNLAGIVIGRVRRARSDGHGSESESGLSSCRPPWTSDRLSVVSRHIYGPLRMAPTVFRELVVSCMCEVSADIPGSSVVVAGCEAR